MRSVHVLSLISILVVSLFSSATSASQFGRCATYVIAARQKHFIPALSAIETRKALQTAHIFRSQHLNEFEYEGRQEAVNGSSRSRRATRAAIAGRLSGIVLDARADIQIGPDGLAQKRELYGTQFVGTEQINAELLRRRETRQLAERLIQPQLPVFIVGPFMIAAQGMTLAIVFKNTTQSLASPSTLTGIAFGLLGLTYFRTVPEAGARALSNWNTFGIADDRALARGVRRLKDQASGWFYRSSNVRVPLDMIRELWANPEVTSDTANDFLHNLMVPRSMNGRTGLKLSFATLGGSNEDEGGWLQIDELAIYDPLIEDVRLVTFVRLDRTLPPYPEAAPARPVPSAVPELQY